MVVERLESFVKIYQQTLLLRRTTQRRDEARGGLKGAAGETAQPPLRNKRY